MARKKSFFNLSFLSMAFCIAWIALFSVAVYRTGKQTREEQRLALQQAIERDISSCYALEGIFPPDLAYMKEHYGLSYDESLFYVDYRPIASNLRPDYAILVLEGDEDGLGFDERGRILKTGGTE